MLNTACPEDWDMLAIQEPYLNHLGNTKASSHWRVVYPRDHCCNGSSCSRSVILINANISTDTYLILPVCSMDITAICLMGNFENLAVFNVYNNCTHNKALTALSSFLSSSLHTFYSPATDHMVWMGDFNRHHPLWELPDNHHLNSSEDNIWPLLKLLKDHDMDLALPLEMPTLQTTAGWWTRPDNVWRMLGEFDPLISCTVSPSLCPPITDHLPIVMELELPLHRAMLPPSRDFRLANWDKFNKVLTEKLTLCSPAKLIATEAEFKGKVNNLMAIILEVSNTDEIVLMKMPCPFSKHWWNKDLERLKAQRRHANNLAYRFWDIEDHLARAKAACLSKDMADCIKRSREEHWTNWLEEIDAWQIYITNKYAIWEPLDLSCNRVPKLKTMTQGVPELAVNNANKAGILAESFFPLPPQSTSTPPTTYPKPLLGIKFFTHMRIHATIRKLPPFKAPGPDRVPNVVLKRCSNTLVDHLHYIFRAVMELEVYHKEWLVSTMLVLCKPGRPAYNVAKAY
ncbi:hypothetical protein J132_02997 [Termitomyces sp. J132]|nr:hypothetical protein J132_02997 [Termitomyces sp. J132]